MTEKIRPGRDRVIARRRWSLTIAAIVAVVGSILFLSFGVLAGRWIESRENLHLSLHGAGVDRLQPGDRVVVAVEPVGHVQEVRADGNRAEARLVLKRRQAERIPWESEFRVESLNDWMPGNLGVRIRVPESRGGLEPLRDGAALRATDSFLPPEIPVRFYYLIGAAMLVVAITAGLALAIYRAVCKLTAALIVVAAGALVLVAGYYYFSTLITEPF